MPTSAPHQFPAVKALTLNLLYASGSHPADDEEAGTWNQRRPVVCELVAKHSPDILAFQEVEEQQFQDFCEDFPDYDGVPGPKNGVDRMPLWAKWFSPFLLATSLVLGVTTTRTRRSGLGWLATGCTAISGLAPPVLTYFLHRAKGKALESGGHCPIFWKADKWRKVEEGEFWISNHPEKPNSVLPGAWLPRICHWVELQHKETGQRLQVFNTHLDWWFLARAKGGRIVAQQMNARWSGTPQLLLGDFNAPRESATWNYLIEGAQEDGCLALQDAYQQAAQKTGPEDTYHGGNGEGQYPGRIDHILLRPDGNVQELLTDEYHEGEVWPSDHFALLLTTSG